MTSMNNEPTHRVHRHTYDRIARLADQRLGLYSRETIDEAIRFAKLEGTEAILDTCCGNGELLQYIALSQHRGPLVGVDFSEAMLNVAVRRLKSYPAIALKQEDISHLSQPSDYFHLVFNTNAFHYLEDPSLSLGEFFRVLRPMGRLILVDLAANSRLTRIWAKLRRLIQPSYQQLYQPEDLQHYLEKTGFMITRRKLWRINLLWSVMLFEAQKPALRATRHVP